VSEAQAIATDVPIAGPHPTAASRSGRLAAPFVVALITAAVAAWAIEPWPVGVFQDDGIYAILGKAIARGEGYRYLNLPGAPAATHYPPGYPLVLALIWRLSPVFPDNTALFVFVSVGFLAVAAAGAWYFGHRRLGLHPGVATALALATVACAPALMFGVFVLSEPMFVALLFPILIAAERAADSGSRRDAAAAGLLAGLLALVRTMGQFVALALVLVLIVRRRWSAAAAAIGTAALSIIPWHLWVAAHGADVPPVLMGKYGPYDGWLRGAVASEGIGFVAAVAWKNLRELHALAWDMFTGITDAGAPVVVALGAFVSGPVLIVLGLGARRLARRAPVTLCFSFAYMAIVLAWPFEPTRFVWALLPIFGAMMALGAATVIGWRPESTRGRAGRLAAVAVMALLGTGYLAYNVRAVRTRMWTIMPSTFTQRATPLIEWARTATDPRDLLATDDDAMVHLYSARRTIPVGTFTPQEYLAAQSYDFAATQLQTLLREYRPRYVMCGSAHCVMAAGQLMRREVPLLRLVVTLRRGAIFEPLAP
jgi:hypothetical protein